MIRFVMLTMALAACAPSADRVAEARAVKGSAVRALAVRAGLQSPVRRLYFRAIKQERTLEAWGGGKGKMKLLKKWPIAGMSGELGPKRQEGDRQVPEGLYRIDRFNPKSRFLLSLGLDYPNASDRVRSNPDRPGGDIFVHGDTVSIGCLAMTDPFIQEIYLLALDAQRPIRVDVFPFRFKPGWKDRAQADHLEFWKELEPFWVEFEKTRSVPKFRVARDGRYVLVR